MTDLEQYIHSYFELSGKDMSNLASLFSKTSLKKGEYFLRIGNNCDKLSFIQSGFLRAYAPVGDKEVTQWIGAKGSFVADLAGLTFKAPSRWNIQALTDTELHTIDVKEYKKISKIIPQWPVVENQFIVKCFTMMESRIFALLSLSAEERYAAFFGQNKELFNHVPLQYIASMLGMTPETFSRIRKRQSQ